MIIGCQAKGCKTMALHSCYFPMRPVESVQLCAEHAALYLSAGTVQDEPPSLIRISTRPASTDGRRPSTPRLPATPPPPAPRPPVRPVVEVSAPLPVPEPPPPPVEVPMPRPSPPPPTALAVAVRTRRGTAPQIPTAEVIGIPRSTLSHVESETGMPSPATAMKLARWLGWSVEQVFEAAQAPPPEPPPEG